MCHASVSNMLSPSALNLSLKRTGLDKADFKEDFRLWDSRQKKLAFSHVGIRPARHASSVNRLKLLYVRIVQSARASFPLPCFGIWDRRWWTDAVWMLTFSVLRSLYLQSFVLIVTWFKCWGPRRPHTYTRPHTQHTHTHVLEPKIK
jgi:hypothetical protein